MELKKFANTTREALENMSDSEIWNLGLWEKIERYLIVEGITDHECARKIEVEDIAQSGADGIRFTVVSTLKRKHKPSWKHTFVLNECTHTIEIIGIIELK